MKKYMIVVLALIATRSAFADETFEVAVAAGGSEVTVENVEVNPEEERIVECGDCKVCISCMTTRGKRMTHCRVYLRGESLNESDFETDEDSTEPMTITISDHEDNSLKVRLTPCKSCTSCKCDSCECTSCKCTSCECDSCECVSCECDSCECTESKCCSSK